MLDKNGRDITTVAERIASIIQSVELPKLCGVSGFLSEGIAVELATRIIEELPIWMTPEVVEVD